jgi:hypothetical protein
MASSPHITETLTPPPYEPPTSSYVSRLTSQAWDDSETIEILTAEIARLTEERTQMLSNHFKDLSALSNEIRDLKIENIRIITPLPFTFDLATELNVGNLQSFASSSESSA